MSLQQTICAADKLIQQIERLHSGPQVAQKVLSITRDPDFEIREIVDCLEHDPALSTKVLRLVNSSRYGLAHKVTSVRHAASYLGRRSLRLIVLTFVVVEHLSKGLKGRLFVEYWRRALTMAAVSRQLAERHPEIQKDDAYTAGLLADVGALVLTQYRGETYVDLATTLGHGRELVQAEREQYGCSHALLGARLLQLWGLPESLVKAVAHHHAEAPEPTPLETAVLAANLISDSLWTPNSPSVQAARRILEDAYHADLDVFIDIAVKAQQDVQQSADAFGLTLDNSDVDCQALLDEACRLYSETSFEAALELDRLASPAVPAETQFPQEASL